MKFTVALCTLWLLVWAPPLRAQARAATEFQIARITKNLITAPQWTYDGAQDYDTNPRDRWLEVEVEFAAAPDWTDELTLKFFVLLNGKMLTGDVTHVNVPAGRELRSVMYVTPRTLARLAGNKAISLNMVPNIGVQLSQGGTVKAEGSLERSPAQWFVAVPPLAGLLLNKNETPFAPLYWDRYEQIKSR